MDTLETWLKNRTDAFEASVTPRFANGATFGRWQVVRFVARGGSGEIYRAIDAENSARVAAVKVLHKTDETAHRRFMREIEIFKVIHNKHFPRVFDFGEKDGCVWFAMEFLEPCDLPNVDRDVAARLLEICDALQLLHGMGYVHRDLKPANIMRRADGTVVLVDLGLVKDASAVFGANEESISIVDGKSVGLGTIGYAAPEQLTGGEVSVEADIHALGVLADTCFNGDPPKHWKRLIQKATSSLPGYRYRTVAEFVRAIRRRHAFRNRLIGSSLVLVACSALLLGTVVNQPIKQTPTDTKPVSNPVEPSPALQPSAAALSLGLEIVEVRTNILPTTLHLEGKVYVLNQPVHLKKGETLAVIGPGRLEASISGEEGSCLSLKDCIAMNFTSSPVEKSGLRYELLNGVYLNFANLEKPVAWPNRFRVHDGAFNVIRFKGPLTVEELNREREKEFFQQLKNQAN